MSETKVPKRLRIKPFMSIDGVRQGRRLNAGLYVLGENLSEDEARALASDEFSHCVQVLSDEPAPEPLAKDAEIPKETTAYRYQKEKERNAVLQQWQREYGAHKRPPEKLKDENE